MTAPVGKVEIAPGATWQTEPANIGWVDVTRYVWDSAGIETKRGASSARGQIDTGKVDLAFKNANRYFDPTATTIPITALRLTGASGTYASTPDRAGLDITGDLEVVARIQPDDWTPAADSDIVAKYLTTGDQRSWRLRLLTTGVLRLNWSTNGTIGAVVTASSTANLSALTNATEKWVKATLDVSSGDVQFFTSDDGVEWTQLGSTVTTASTSIFASTALLEIGSSTNGTSDRFDGDIHYVEVRNGIGGPVVANPRFGLQTAGTTSFSDGLQTWTLNGAAAIVASTGPGPFLAFLQPGMPIRYTATPAGQSSKAVAYGTVAKWPQRYDIGNTFAWVPIEGWDGFDKLSRAKIPRSVLESAILADNPVGYWPLDETDGLVMSDRSGHGRHGVYIDGTTDLSTEQNTGTVKTRGLMLDGDHGGRAFDAALYVGTTPATLEALVSGSDEFNFGPISQGNGNANGLKLSVSGAASSSVMAVLGTTKENIVADMSAPHHVAYRGNTGVSDIYIDGEVQSGTPGTSFAVDFIAHTCIGAPFTAGAAVEGYQGWLAQVALYDSDIGDARVAAHAEAALAPLDGQTADERIGWVLDELDWPTNLRDLETGQTFLGPATFKPGDGALEYLRLVTASEDGRLFIEADGTLRFLDRFWRYLDSLATVSQFTFTDTDGDQGYAEFDLDLDDELLVNVARFTRRDGAEQVASDVASVGRYGEAEKQQSNLLQQTDNEVLALAQWTVATQGTPLPRVPKIRVPLHRYTAADQADVLALDIGHRVTCERTPQGIGSGISLDFLIDGVTNTVGSGEWWWEAFVSPVPEDTAPLFLLSDSLMSGADVLAY